MTSTSAFQNPHRTPPRPETRASLGELQSRRARAVSRLVLFSASTAWNMARLAMLEATGSASPERGVRQTHAWCRQLLSWLDIDVRIKGTPPKGGVVIASNHRSYMDIAVVGAQLPCVFLAKQEIADWPLVGRSARLAGTVFVERGNRSSGVAAVKALRELLERRLNVTVFPEGTTTRGPGLLPFQGAIFRQAAQMGASVVPVALSYDDPADGWTNDDGSFVEHFLDRFGKRRITVSLSFGPEMHETSASALRGNAHAWIAGELAGVRLASAPLSEPSASA